MIERFKYSAIHDERLSSISIHIFRVFIGIRNSVFDFKTTRLFIDVLDEAITEIRKMLLSLIRNLKLKL